MADFSFGDLTAKKIAALKAIKESDVGYLGKGDTYYSEAINSIMGSYSDWQKQVSKSGNPSSIFDVMNAYGLESVFNLLDADGNGKINSKEAESLADLTNDKGSDYKKGKNYTYNDFNEKVSTVDVYEFVLAALDEAIKLEDNDNANKSSKTDTSDKTDKTDKTDKVDKADKTDKTDKTNKADDKATEKTTKTTETLKPTNDSVTVTKWGTANKDGERNDCLLHIIQNNYDKDIKYGTDEYWKIANAIMDSNPNIYGTEDKLARKIVGGTGRDSSVLYTGEKVKLPSLETESEKKVESKDSDTTKKTDSVKDSSSDSQDAKAKEDTAKESKVTTKYLDGGRTKQTLDENGKLVKEEYIDKSSGKVTSTKSYTYENDGSYATSTVDANGNVKYESKYDKDGKLISSKDNTQKNTQITDYDKGKESATQISNIITDMKDYDGSDKAKYYHKNLDEIQKLLNASSTDGVQGIISQMKEEDFAELTKVLNKDDSGWFSGDIGKDYSGLIDKLYAPDLDYPENIEKMLKVTDGLSSDKYAKKEYFNNFRETLADIGYDSNLTDEQKTVITEFYSQAQEYYNHSGGVTPDIMNTFVPRNDNGEIVATADSLYDSLDSLDKMSTAMPDNYKYSYESTANFWKLNMVNSLSTKDFAKIIKQEGSVSKAEQFLADTMGCQVADLKNYLTNYSEFYDAKRSAS